MLPSGSSLRQEQGNIDKESLFHDHNPACCYYWKKMIIRAIQVKKSSNIVIIALCLNTNQFLLTELQNFRLKAIYLSETKCIRLLGLLQDLVLL